MTKIEWTDDTWNPVVGCTKVSTGCDNCYAERMALRQAGMEYARYNENANCEYPQPFEGGKYSDVVNTSKRCWNGETFCDEKALEIPLHWKKPKLIFVCSMGDLFHPSVPFVFIDRVFAVMALCSQHTFQVLTKRTDRMAEYLTYSKRSLKIMDTARQIAKGRGGEFMNDAGVICWPLPNVWFGVTAENQEQADKRIPILLQIPAAVRFVSVEPMLGVIKFRKGKKGEIFKCLKCNWQGRHTELTGGNLSINCPKCNARNTLGSNHENELKDIGHYRGLDIDWVICGGESGAGARPMHPDWARSLRDQCMTAGVPFLFKQWGAWAARIDVTKTISITKSKTNLLSFFSKRATKVGNLTMFRVGKKKAGRLLDGIEHNEYPKRGG